MHFQCLLLTIPCLSHSFLNLSSTLLFATSGPLWTTLFLYLLNLSRSSFYHLRRLRAIRRSVSMPISSSTVRTDTARRADPLAGFQPYGAHTVTGGASCIGFKHLTGR